MTRYTKTFLLAGALMGTGACAKMNPGPTPKTSATATAEDPAAAVAKINGQVITAAELSVELKGPLSRLESEHAEKVHGMKAQALESLVEKRLIAAKAKAENITPEKLIEREVTSKIPAPADSEIQTVYDRTKSSGRELPPFDQVKGDIAKFLKEQGAGKTRQEYIAKLKAESKVEMLLPPLMPAKVEISAEGGVSKGEAKAPITIVEFSDFECPFCGRAEETVKKVMEHYKGKVRLVFRDFPLPFHAKAQKASEAALCAGDQGKYWEMHEKLFTNQTALDPAQLKDHAKGIGLEGGKFDKCLESGEKAKLVEASKKAGEAVGVTGTPAFFINGRMISGAQPFERFKEIIDFELKASGS